MIFNIMLIVYGFILIGTFVLFTLHMLFLTKKYTLIQERFSSISFKKFKGNKGTTTFLAGVPIIALFYFIGLLIYRVNEANLLISTIYISIIALAFMWYEKICGDKIEDSEYIFKKYKKYTSKNKYNQLKPNIYREKDSNPLVLAEKEDMRVFYMGIVLFILEMALYFLDLFQIINIQVLLVGELAPLGILFLIDLIKILLIVVSIMMIGRSTKNIITRYVENYEEKLGGKK